MSAIAENVTGAPRRSFEIPSLDGIRAIAVLTVFIGHGQTIGGPWPGDVGVTIFFFLSGYLIVTLLRREFTRTGRISLVTFYLRRVLRIQPPALIAIALAVTMGLTGVLPSTMTPWGVASQVFNYSNYYMIWADGAHGDPHFGLPPESSQLWSLSVEEHFYLIIPAALLLLFRTRLTVRKVGFILLGLCALGPLWRVVLALIDPNFYHLYIATDARFDGLLAGAAMALLANPALGDPAPFGLSGSLLVKVASPVAFAVFVLVALSPAAIGLTVGDTLIYACLVPLFWLVITRPEGVVGRVLNYPVVAHIGVLSFSMYLLHRTALGVSQLFVGNPLLSDALALVLTVAGAEVVYRVVERPLSRVRKRLEGKVSARRPVAVAAGAR